MFESVDRKPATSRTFRYAVMFGLAMTILARVGPWDWPGWPARTVLDFALAHAAPSVAGPFVTAAGLIVLAVVNAGFWAVIAYAALRLRTRLAARR